MSLASAAGVLLKPQTPLQQLLEDINFQRTKEMRQLLKDDSGFVVLQGTTYWTDLFVRHFLFQNEPEQSIDSDDLLFFVRKKHVKSSSRHQPKFETEVEVFRKDSRKLPIGDPDVDWEETVYLNMVIHQFDYTLTLAICTRTSPKELQVLRRHSQRVYASPSRRKMDTKGEGEEITYPHICFMVDNFDEVFSDILVRDGEMVCVELVANDKNGCIQGVIFLGSIRYDALKKVYDARQSSLSSKVAQRMSFGLFSSGAAVQTRCEFVRMKGPQGKGHAEMAVTKPKGSGVETPTSEPGFCATDIWDDWEDENDDYCTYRHQRRLSDPSANLNNFTRYTWRTKNVQDVTGTSVGAKARSENEGLDSIANEVSEIEAGDLRDDRRPAFSVSEVKLHENPKNTANGACTTDKDNKCAETTHNINCNGSPNVSEVTEATMVLSPTLDKSHSGCGGCFGGSGSNKKCKSWAKSGVDKNTPEMSEIYCPTCDDRKNETPACLNKMPDKKMIPKNEMELKNSRLNLKTKERKSATIARSASLSVADRRVKKQFENVSKTKEKIKMKEKDKFIDKLITEKPKKEENDIKKKSVKTSILAKVSPKRLRAKNKEAANVLSLKESSKIHEREAREQLNPKTEEYEIADDATSLNADELNVIASGFAKMAILKESDTKSMINVRGKEELPVVEDANLGMQSQDNHVPYKIKICKNVPDQSDTEPLNVNVQQNDNLSPQVQSDEPQKFNQIAQCLDNNRDDIIISDSSKENDNADKTLLHDKHTAAQQTFFNKAISFVPKKRTPDGTNIYYWCDLPKRALKELDDGAYNPLWASRGFTQSFHFWKEHRRQQSVPLNAFLTYVTLPWWSIAKDLLDHRETPILTF